MLGRMIASGVNGYLQTRSSRGLLCGLLAGAMPGDLRLFGDINNDPVACIANNLVRDTLCSAAVGGPKRVLRGLFYRQLNTLLGHATAWVASGFKGPACFKDGAFFYEKGRLFNDRAGALVIGNVICGPRGLCQRPHSYLYKHEMCHVHHPLEQALGALYIPVHLLDLLIGRLGERLGKGYRWYVFEEHVQAYPYSQRA